MIYSVNHRAEGEADEYFSSNPLRRSQGEFERNTPASCGVWKFFTLGYVETRWVLKVVESDISYLANDNMQAVFASMDPGSEIFKRMSIQEKDIAHDSVWSFPLNKRKIS